MRTRLRLAEKPLERSPHRYPSSAPRSLYLSYITYTLSYSQVSLEGAARGAGWSCGMVGVQPSAGAATGASIPAILVVRTAHIRMHPKICRSHAILARSVEPWCCSMHAYAFCIAALHSGMRVVRVWVREKVTLAPPIGA